MWISTTEKDKWSSANTFSDEKGIEINIGEELGKPIFGWGCCISELHAIALSTLSKDDQKAIMDELFGEDGCGFNYCRLSVGANDFAESWYSYNETDGDYEMKNFSIDRDKKWIIPTIKEAQKRSSELMFFASPWSPPTWMKFPKVYNFGRLVQTDENLKAYALYFKKFVEAYAKEGIKISQIMPQNEFFADQKFPSCVYNEQQMENFVANYLIDELDGIADVWMGTINAPGLDDCHSTHISYIAKFMQNEKIKNNIKGAAFQWAGKASIMPAYEDYPELDSINSEWQCGDGKNTWEYAMYGYELFHHYFKFGARANVYWNMALDNDGMSSWGWHQNSLVKVENGKYTYTPDYYMVKHFAHFVKRGAVMLKTQGSFSSNTTIFKNPDGSLVAVVLNPFDEQKVLTIKDKNYVLKPRSFNTMIL